MRSSQRVALLVGAAVVLVIGFIVANSGGGASKSMTATVRRFDVVVAGGKPRGGIKQLVANKGDTIGLTIRSNVADEIHIHGYDLKKTVPAGGSVQFSFTATIDGNFVIELESRAEQIASLTVKL